MLARILRDDNDKWYHGSLSSPIRCGVVYDLEDGWSFKVTQIAGKYKKRFTVSVYRAGVEVYTCIISHTKKVYLFPETAVELKIDDAAHLEIAPLVARAIGARHQRAVLGSVRIVPAINGLTYQSRANELNIFTDAHTTALPSTPPRMFYQCNGGSYLVRTIRHEGSYMYALHVTVQPDCDIAALTRCISTL